MVGDDNPLEGHPLDRKAGAVGSVYGLIAEYPGTRELLVASRLIRDAGYTRWDTYTPFPVHGIESAMGLRSTRLPWFVLGTGIGGGIVAVVVQWFTNARDYRWVVSGKPFLSVPTMIPVTVVLTLLVCAVSAFVGMLWCNGLPRLSNPLQRSAAFQRVTNDRFCLVIEARDPKFQLDVTQTLLTATLPITIQIVAKDDAQQTFPKSVVYGLWAMTAIAIVPIALVAIARGANVRHPRRHLISDMDFQLKYKSDSQNGFFEDGRASRAPVEGAVADGDLREDSHRYRGKVGGAYATRLPKALPVSVALSTRGRERFGVFCAPCHGAKGKGDGLVSIRAVGLAEGAWAPPIDLRQEYIRNQPDGQLFETVTQGTQNMPAFGNEVTTDDRWAIVLYLRALARSVDANGTDALAKP